MSSSLMDGKVVVITGGNTGIGQATATALAALGATVVITSRVPSRGEAALKEIRSGSGNEHVEMMELDLADFASIRAFAAAVLERYDRIDVLVLNAGLVLGHRTETTEGFENTFGVNHLGHFLLTQLLLERLEASAPSRVVVLASDAHRMAIRGLNFDDLQSTRHYRAFDAYAKSKLANVLFTRELARRLEGTGVTANCAHPGYVNSHFGRDGDYGFEGFQQLGARLFAISPEEGARTSVHLASAPELTTATGGYYAKSKLRNPSKAARDDAAAGRLWEESERLVASVST
jgi:NAD(P)-dependent dehydrogenase (short-subunit alcohol dehydrogenase family)